MLGRRVVLIAYAVFLACFAAILSVIATRSTSVDKSAVILVEAISKRQPGIVIGCLRRTGADRITLEFPESSAVYNGSTPFGPTFVAKADLYNAARRLTRGVIAVALDMEVIIPEL